VSSNPSRKAAARSLFLLTLAALLASCFGGGEKQEFFYFVPSPPAALEMGSGGKILVSDFSVSAGYDSSRLAYRISSNELRYYAFRQWVSDPGRMLTEATVRLLRASGHFSDVAKSERIREPDMILEGNVEAIEEIDSGKTWQARLAMTLIVRTSEPPRILFRHGFDRTVPLDRRHPEEVAKAVGSILEKEIKLVAEKMSRSK
jgi:ABC-type uncharacterized transport system auxiliary subunit